MENKPWEKQNNTKDWKKRHLKVSLISFSFALPFPCLRESQCKQLRNSYINSFPKMGSTETITQFWKKRKIALHGWRKVSKYVVTVSVEWAPVRRYCGMRSLYARKQPSLLYFGFVFFVNLVPRTFPLAFELRREILGTFGKASDKIQPNIVDFGWMEKSTRWHTKLFLAMPWGSLSFRLHHQGLERDLECYLRLLFLCTKHENGINPRHRLRSIGRRSDTFRSS